MEDAVRVFLLTGFINLTYFQIQEKRVIRRQCARLKSEIFQA